MFRTFTSDAKSLIKGNIKALTVRDMLYTMIAGLTGGLDALYVKEVLGADAIILGLIASIWSAAFLFFILIGGWMSDHYDRKKMLIIGMALTLPNPIIFALAPDWRVIILANLLGALGAAFSAPAYIALLYSSSEQKTRSRVLAVMNTLICLVNVFVPPLGALAIQRFGGLDEIRKVFIAQFFLSIIVLFLTNKKLKSSVKHASAQPKGLTDSIKSIFGQMTNIYQLSKERKATAWLFIAISGPWAWETIAPLWIIYAAEICKSSLMIIGFLPAVYSLTAAILLYPLAKVSDRKGRKKVIILVRPFLYFCVAALIVGGTFPELAITPLIPLLAWIFRAIGDSSGPSWTAASTEVIPDELQSEWEATRDFLWRVMTIPAAIFGGLLWNVDPRLPFVCAFLVDGLVRLPILIRLIPETLIVYKSPQPPGPHVIVYGLPSSGRTSIAQLIQKKLDLLLIEQPSTKQRQQIHQPLFKFTFFGDRKHIKMDDQVSEALSQKKTASVIEGEAALFAANEKDKGVIVLLVASKDERIRRKTGNSQEPEFVALRELEEKDREVVRLTRQLYGVDISKLPPFDIAINTERISPEKIVKFISMLREKDEIIKDLQKNR
jgi:MFS family permease